MLVFWKQHLVFLSVPKTGSTAWSQALAPHASMVVSDPPELKHAPLYRYNRFFRPMFDRVGGQPELLAVLREPVDWLGSWYRYRQRGALEGTAQSTRGITFDSFVRAYLQDDRPAFAQVGSQAKFIEPRNNGLHVAHLFRYENQTALVAFLEDRLGVAIDLPHRNPSPPADLSLTPETRARLQDACAADFDAWARAN